MDEIKSHVDPMETIELLKNLIRINSVNPSLVEGAPGESQIAEFIADFMEDIGLETKLMEVEKNRPNVVGVLKGVSDGPFLMLNGHTDTVGIEYMEMSPFEPVVEGNKIYGRGACDMKGGLAAMLSAAKAIIDSGIKLKGNVIIAAVVDEEYTSIGTERLIKDHTADAAIVCEPTELQVAIAHKGYVWSKIETHGKAAHGSRPETGVDAIMKMSKFLIEIEKLQRKIFPTKTHRLVGPPSVHASLIEGGRELSTYPDYCKLQIERRTVPGENVNAVKEEIQNILDKLSKEDPQFEASFDIIFSRGPIEVSPDIEISQKLRHAILKITGGEPRYIGVSGWLDSEILYNAGVPVVVFGPGELECAHSAVEYTYLDQVITAAKILSQTIVNFCS